MRTIPEDNGRDKAWSAWGRTCLICSLGHWPNCVAVDSCVLYYLFLLTGGCLWSSHLTARLTPLLARLSHPTPPSHPYSMRWARTTALGPVRMSCSFSPQIRMNICLRPKTRKPVWVWRILPGPTAVSYKGFTACSPEPAHTLDIQWPVSQTVTETCMDLFWSPSSLRPECPLLAFPDFAMEIRQSWKILYLSIGVWAALPLPGDCTPGREDIHMPVWQLSWLSTPGSFSCKELVSPDICLELLKAFDFPLWSMDQLSSSSGIPSGAELQRGQYTTRLCRWTPLLGGLSTPGEILQVLHSLL